MKKLASLTLVLIMCFALLPALAPHAAAADGHYLEINSTTFPDASFRNWILANLAYSVDGDVKYMTQDQVESVTTINCADCGIETLNGIEHFTKLRQLYCRYNRLTSMDVSMNTLLYFIDCSHNELTSLDVSKNTALKELHCHFNRLSALDVRNNTKLCTLNCGNNLLTTLDLDANTELEHLQCYTNHLTALRLDNNTKILSLYCYENDLAALDLSKNTSLETLNCRRNHLTTLNVSKLTKLETFSANGQTVAGQKGKQTADGFVYQLTKIVPQGKLSNVTIDEDDVSFDATTGEVTFLTEVDTFTYQYNAGADSNGGDIELPELPASVGSGTRGANDRMMDVTVYLTFEKMPDFDGTVEIDARDVSFNGKTPYLIWDGSAKTPRFAVKAKDGSVVDPSNYTYEYRENVNAGTGYVIVTFKALYAGTARGWFKIYLPATKQTAVENVQDGIRVTWAAVPGAVGYVVYRRAWSTTTGGWTNFARWDNTTDTTYLDGYDATHKTYAGTRYQYGVKAYFAQRVDPISGATIGGNVGDNYNLGVVGPLKTTVRITTRVLNSVKGGSKRLTISWTPSKNFTGYEVQIATDAAFTKNVKTVKIAEPLTSETTIKSLKAKKTYYVRVRSYHEFEGFTYYGGWSNVLSAKTKS